MKTWKNPEVLELNVSETAHGYPNTYTDGSLFGIPTHGPKDPNYKPEKPGKPEKPEIDSLS